MCSTSCWHQKSQLGQGLTVVCVYSWKEEAFLKGNECSEWNMALWRFEVVVLLSSDIGLGPVVASSTLEFRADIRTTELDGVSESCDDLNTKYSWPWCRSWYRAWMAPCVPNSGEGSFSRTPPGNGKKCNIIELLCLEYGKSCIRIHYSIWTCVVCNFSLPVNSL